MDIIVESTIFVVVTLNSIVIGIEVTIDSTINLMLFSFDNIAYIVLVIRHIAKNIICIMLVPLFLVFILFITYIFYFVKVGEPIL